MLLDILFSDNIWLSLLSLIIVFPALLFSLSAHEFAHGFAAYKQGDNFAKNTGRLTLNPLKHLDPIGTLMMLLVGFGWAKPVPIVPSNFKNGRKSMLIVSFAGVFTNLILATVSMFLLYFFQFVIFAQNNFFFTEIGIAIWDVVYYVLYLLVFINLNLAVFNLIPIPPLDGYKIFKEFLGGRVSYNFFMNMERYATVILLVFLVVSNRVGIISGVSDFLFGLMQKVMNLIFIAFM